MSGMGRYMLMKEAIVLALCSPYLGLRQFLTYRALERAHMGHDQ